MTQRTIRQFVIKSTIALLFVVGAYIEAGPLTAVAIGFIFVQSEFIPHKPIVTHLTIAGRLDPITTAQDIVKVLRRVV